MIKKSIIIGAIILYGIALRINYINRPFIGIQAANGAYIVTFAYNYVKYGYLSSNFIIVNNFDNYISKENRTYYVSYPPLVMIILSIPLKFFGRTEFSARILYIINYIAVSCLFATILLKYFGKLVAYISIFSFSILPLTRYYDSIPEFVQIETFFLLLLLFQYLRWLETPNKRDFIILHFLCFISLFTGWLCFLSAFVIILIEFIRNRDRSNFKFFFRFYIVENVLFVTIFLSLVYSQIKERLYSSVFLHAIERTGIVNSEKNGLVIIDFIKYVPKYYFKYCTIIGGLIGIVVFFYFVFNIRKIKNNNKSIIIIFFLFLPGFLRTVIFQSAAAYNDIWIYTNSLFITFSIGFVFNWLWHKNKIFKYAALLILIIFIFQSYSTTRGLFSFKRNNYDYLIGKFINENTKMTDKIYTNIYSSILLYYMNRNFSGYNLDKTIPRNSFIIDYQKNIGKYSDKDLYKLIYNNEMYIFFKKVP